MNKMYSNDAMIGYFILFAIALAFVVFGFEFIFFLMALCLFIVIFKELKGKQ